MSNILVVDEYSIAEVLRDGLALKVPPIKVDFATDLHEAEQAMRGNRPYSPLQKYFAAVISYRFQGGRGVDVANELARRGYGGLVVITSGDNLSMVRATIRRLYEGDHPPEYLKKPFDLDELTSMLASRKVA